MEFKGTKGNWELLNDEHFLEVQIKNPLKSICAINSNVLECKANAKLIASAPELLEALQGLIRWTAHFPQAMNEEIQAALNAIQKAT